MLTALGANWGSGTTSAAFASGYPTSFTPGVANVTQNFTGAVPGTVTTKTLTTS